MLEKSIRNLVREGRSVEVLTGPLFLPFEENGKKYVKYEVIGENNVAVPTHFFKMVKVHLDDHVKDLKVYIIPNVKISNEISFEVFEESIEKLEKISGLRFIKTGSPNHFF